MCSTQRLRSSQIESVYRLVDGDHTCVASTSGLTWDRTPVPHSKCCCFLSMATTSLSRTNYLTSCLTPKEARKELASEGRNISILACFSVPFLQGSRWGAGGGHFSSITLHNKLFIYWISVLPSRVSLNLVYFLRSLLWFGFFSLSGMKHRNKLAITTS